MHHNEVIISVKSFIGDIITKSEEHILRKHQDLFIWSSTLQNKVSSEFISYIQQFICIKSWYFLLSSKAESN